MGWGPLHLGYAGSSDPEPGRCRRTDGKKWRCSRDAVPDQKYCERHINRGRHRSRKHVEGRTANAGQAPTGPATTPDSNAGGTSAAAHTSAGHLNRYDCNSFPFVFYMFSTILNIAYLDQGNWRAQLKRLIFGKNVIRF